MPDATWRLSMSSSWKESSSSRYSRRSRAVILPLDWWRSMACSPPAVRASCLRDSRSANRCAMVCSIGAKATQRETNTDEIRASTVAGDGSYRDQYRYQQVGRRQTPTLLRRGTLDLALDLHEFDQRGERGRGMHERDRRAARSGTGRLVDQARARALESLERRGAVEHAV